MMRGWGMRSMFVGMAAVALVAVCAAGAQAKMLTVWPDKFIMSQDAGDPVTEPTIIAPGGLRGHGSYYSVINLPVGATVKKVWVNYTKDVLPDPPPEPTPVFSLCVWLRRQLPTASEEDLIDFNLSNVETIVGTHSVANAPADVVGPLAVRSGYRYFLVWEPNYGGVLNSIQVEYTAP